ncbi:MAG: hypothetical protein M0R77_03100 [Gammaproteobacteria bacterium]|nr:hypothetical protein [Gammaproteobacteria bacterium]
MGCWSESCAISGLEIGAYCEAVVMVVKPVSEDAYTEYGSFSRFVPVCPPTFGVYSDYGDIEGEDARPEQLDSKFFLDQLEKARRIYDPNKTDHMEYMGQFWWCRKDVWDYCDALPLEFSYGDNPKTIGEAVEKQRINIKKYVDVQLDIQNSVDDEEGKLRRLFRSISSARDIFGLGHIDGNFVIGLKQKLDFAIEQGDLETINNVVESALRVLKVSLMCYELRKIVCPSTRAGPQHGGYEAILSLNKFTLAKCQEYFAEYGEED